MVPLAVAALDTDQRGALARPAVSVTLTTGAADFDQSPHRDAVELPRWRRWRVLALAIDRRGDARQQPHRRSQPRRPHAQSIGALAAVVSGVLRKLDTGRTTNASGTGSFRDTLD
jgi:hypothetical protein